MFASLSHLEGLGLPPLGAMAAGCLAADVQADATQLQNRRAAGQATAARFDVAQFKAGLDAAWQHVLGDEARLYRLPAVKAGQER